MIHFVGAGPGADDLITIRGAKLLESADVVIYAGSLVNPELLKYAPNAEINNSATMTLDEVISVMEAAQTDGKTVVRLHTGDPSVYGAIREQMDCLTRLDIPFDVCPGVSALGAAAASLKSEYTLPGVSQTVIITRIAGRTPTADGETTILFLSAGQGAKAQDELLKKHAPDTPAAIVCKASWADEKIYRCTVGTLAKTLAQSGISKHALICAGDFLGNDYDLSRLYADDFETGFRKAKTGEDDCVKLHEVETEKDDCAKFRKVKTEEDDCAKFHEAKTRDDIKIAIATATERGLALAEKIKKELSYNCILIELADIDDNIFDTYNALICICAVQIAVRKIAPLARSKLSDPAVVVCDEAGRWAISLLSGHIGGANRLAEEIASIIGATPVITTASERLGFPKEPKNIVIGIGCRKGTSTEAIERAVTVSLYKHGISAERLCAAASVDIKKKEQGLIDFARIYGLPLTLYSAEELNAAEGEFTHSEFVNETAGVDNVCERAAVLCGGAGNLVIKKTAKDGVTVAAFEKMAEDSVTVAEFGKAAKDEASVAAFEVSV